MAALRLHGTDPRNAFRVVCSPLNFSMFTLSLVELMITESRHTLLGNRLVHFLQ